jgi:hypothetical protein
VGLQTRSQRGRRVRDWAPMASLARLVETPLLLLRNAVPARGNNPCSTHGQGPPCRRFELDHAQHDLVLHGLANVALRAKTLLELYNVANAM